MKTMHSYSIRLSYDGYDRNKVRLLSTSASKALIMILFCKE